MQDALFLINNLSSKIENERIQTIQLEITARYKKEKKTWINLKWKLGNGKCLGSTVLRTLNVGHNQLVKRLNKGYPKLQAQIQSKLDKDKREETGEVTTVLEYVLVA